MEIVSRLFDGRRFDPRPHIPTYLKLLSICPELVTVSPHSPFLNRTCPIFSEDQLRNTNQGEVNTNQLHCNYGKKKIRDSPQVPDLSVSGNQSRREIPFSLFLFFSCFFGFLERHHDVMCYDVMYVPTVP